MQNIKILIVEDDINLASMYKIKFEKEWFEVKIANNWLIAVTQIAEFKPNIILLDIMMPSMDWFETLKVIRQLAPSITCKIIMFSNLNDKADIEKSMRLWADAYLLKADTTPKQAVEKIQELLNISSENKITWQNKNHIQKTCPHCWHTIHVNLEIIS